ncbi:MAG: carboxypeptidase regulatory-like domain-containing protein, partial [bacterium]|nr:carboxypeptidase regulatory-like domain-containing protein [bacterium]
ELYKTIRNRNDAYGVFTSIVKYYSGNNNNWGELSGKVTDGSGNPVENAVISLSGVFFLQTGKDGSYKFICIDPGEYNVRIDAYGFEEMSEKITIEDDGKVKRDFRLYKRR